MAGRPVRKPVAEGQPLGPPGDLKNRVREALGSWPERRAGRAVVGLVIVLGVLDFVVGPKFSLLPLYAGPVALAAWLARPAVAYALAVLAALTVVGVPFLSGTQDPGPILWNIAAVALLLLVVAWLAVTLVRHLREEASFAATDTLTRLLNRGSFISKLDAELARSSRYGRAFTLAYIDLDHFKAVNDLEGHDAGDEVLSRVADTLRSGTRQTDVLGRLGGDEFAALLPETTGGPSGSVLEKVERNLVTAMEKGGWPVTFSIGVVTFEVAVESSREALRIADEAMYAVKRSGRNGIHHLVWDGDADPP